MTELKVPEGIITHTTCRVCGQPNLDDVLSLNTQFLTNFVDSTSDVYYAAPLELVICNKRKGGCGLVQLRHSVPGELLYRQFWYKSGTNQTMRDALSDISNKAIDIVKPERGEIVLDIGANDGTLLRSYKNANLIRVGFEPAANLLQDAKVGSSKIISDFFNADAFKNEFPNQHAKIVTSIAMFYDLEDPNAFVRDVGQIMAPDGIWIIQMNYLVTMLLNNAFDNIVHEHLEYYSLKSLEILLERHNLTVFDAQLNDLNGGSIRVYVKHKNCEKYRSTVDLEEIRAKESQIGLDEYETYLSFAHRIKDLKEKTYRFIKKEVASGKRIYAYGASTRGNTLLQYYALDQSLITAAVDRNPMKWGKKTVGTLIPIISEEQARRDMPDYFLILPWYFIKEFRDRESKFLSEGGKFIIPLPEFQVISKA